MYLQVAKPLSQHIDGFDLSVDNHDVVVLSWDMEDDVVIREGAWRRRAREINKREGETEREKEKERERERERESMCGG